MTISAEDFRVVSEFVHREAAIVLDAGKEYLVEARLLPVANAEGFPSLAALVSTLKGGSSHELRRKVVDALTTHETSFFRDLLPFQALQKQILPELIEARRAERRLTIWSAACSTGQEPYSIAMVMREKFPELASWDIRILASDISHNVLEKARAGHYTQAEINRGLPAPYLVKYFTREGPVWKVKDLLKEGISFQEFNLIGSFAGLPKFDLIFIRNVMIYFDLMTKIAIFEKLRRHLHPDGYLFLGTAETTFNVDDGFERRDIEGIHVYALRKGGTCTNGLVY